MSLFCLGFNEQNPFQRQFDSIGNIHGFQERIDSFKIIVIAIFLSNGNYKILYAKHQSGHIFLPKGHVRTYYGPYIAILDINSIASTSL